jgi:lipopolysaccharide transport system ATP-binding protein
MNDQPVIELARVSKSYSLERRPLQRLWQQLRGQEPTGHVHHALHDVDLIVRRGESVGIIGRNGAGKSTLLQVICGVLQPSRENVRLNGPLLGLAPSQIERRLDEIVDFAGIGEYIDQPVRSYSSGMFVRLAFSMATSVEPDILVIDEALSVGDGVFARKSFERIMNLKDRGATILFCSHSLFQVEQLCTRAVWLHDGRIQFDGLSHQTVVEYNAWEARSDNGSAAADGPVVARFDSASAALIDVRLVNGPPDGIYRSGVDALEVAVHLKSDPAIACPTLGVLLHTADGRTLSSAGNWLDSVPLQRDAAGEVRTRVCFPQLPLLKGRYTLSAYVLCDRSINIYSAAEHVLQFEVTQEGAMQGLVMLPRRWEVGARQA